MVFEPFLEGKGETHFRPVPDRFRKRLSHRVDQNLLWTRSRKLHARGERGRIFHERMVEEGHANLEGVRHRHHVGILQKLVLHIEREVEIGKQIGGSERGETPFGTPEELLLQHVDEVIHFPFRGAEDRRRFVRQKETAEREIEPQCAAALKIREAPELPAQRFRPPERDTLFPRETTYGKSLALSS